MRRSPETPTDVSAQTKLHKSTAASFITGPKTKITPLLLLIGGAATLFAVFISYCKHRRMGDSWGGGLELCFLK